MTRFAPRSARRLSFFLAFAFVAFILITAPHLVHHVFDDEHEAPPCQAFAIAKGCHARAVPVVAVVAVWTYYQPVAVHPDIWTPNFSSAPFSQRAPPGFAS